MKLEINLFKPKIEVDIKHNGETLSYPANVFTRRPFEQGCDVFEQINQYWEAQPADFQDAVFAVYKRVDSAFDGAMDGAELYSILNECICELVRLHPLDRLELWLKLNPGIIVPSSVKSELPDPTDNTKTLGKTYIVSDYYPLIALAMFLRVMVPIWGEYVASIRKASEINKKEFIAMQLLNKTGILECPAMLRLRFYIDEITGSNENIDLDAVMDGFSSEDIGFRMVSLVCILRLCLVDLTGANPHTHAVAVVFKYLAQKVFNAPESRIVVKKEADDESGHPDKHSILESYRRRTEISLGDQAAFGYYFENSFAIAKRLEPSLTDDEISQSLMSAQNIEVGNVGDVQLTIAGWVIKDLITPHAPYYVSDPHPLLLGALEAVLWKRGYKYLAAVLTSYAIIGNEEITVGNISSREQISPQLAEEIKYYYPYQWGSVKKTSVPMQPGVLESIDHVVDDLVFNSWRMTLREDKVIELFGERRRKLAVPSDIKNLLAALIIDIEKRKY